MAAASASDGSRWQVLREPDTTVSTSHAQDTEGIESKETPSTRCRRLDNDLRQRDSLTRPRRQLLRLIRELAFGTIENLVVCNRQPVWAPFPACTQSFALAKTACLAALAPDGQRSALKDVELKLFQILDDISGTARVTIYVQDGLPVRMVVKYPDQHWLSIIQDN